ncbi:MAG: porphobilinogen synthase, partial [Candidatus Tectomicrobia bacterium]|nr:porphobilinogen synthase [Candidatus Tectomicrobia bacterium]
MAYRPRRLRETDAIRRMVRETRLDPSGFIYPLFVVPGKGARREIPPMPGNYQLSVDRVAEEAAKVVEAGVPAVMLFGIPERKDEEATGAWAD